MSSIAKRLREFRAAVGLTQREVASLCGLGKRTIIYWEMGDREIKCSKLIPLADEYDLDFNWLILGRGHMFSDGKIQAEAINQLEYDEPVVANPILEPSLNSTGMAEHLADPDIDRDTLEGESVVEEPGLGIKPEQEDVLTLIQRLRRQ